MLASPPTLRPSAFWPTVWLVLALLAVKASYVELSSFWTWARARDYVSWLFLQWAAAASQADVLFALGAGMVAAGALLITRRRSRVGKLVFGLFFFFGFSSIVYAVISRQVFAYYHAPLTYQLLALIPSPARVSSSLEPFLTVRAISAVLGLPVAYVLVCWGTWRLEASRRPAIRTIVRAGLCIAVVAWLLVGNQLRGSKWFQAQDRHLADSSHWALLESTLSVVLGAQSSITAVEVLPEDVRDFSMAAAPGSLSPSPRDRPRNVILIVLESVGTRYLRLYGSSLDTTPRLVAEQENALVFDRYYAPVAWTAYSLISLVLSRRPPMEVYNERSFRTVKLEGESLAAVLRGHGYRTAFMASGDPDWASEGFLESNGFDEIRRSKDLRGAKKISSWGTRDRFLFDSMLSWIDKGGRQPFFLMAWTDQTHHPYKIAPGQARTELLSPEMKKRDESLGRYVSLIREADTQIGRLLDGLRESGLAEDTLVVVTGDHGEAFGEPHGGSGHGFTVYDEEVRVPLMFWNPRLYRRGGHSQAIGSHTDLAPTLLEVLGIPPPNAWDGRSLFATGGPPRAYLFAAAWGQHLLGVREENWKYIYDVRGGREELYDLATDRDEQKNVATAHSGLSQRLRHRLAAWVQVERQRREAGKMHSMSR